MTIHVNSFLIIKEDRKKYRMEVLTNGTAFQVTNRLDHFSLMFYPMILGSMLFIHNHSLTFIQSSIYKYILSTITSFLYDYKLRITQTWNLTTTSTTPNYSVSMPDSTKTNSSSPSPTSLAFNVTLVPSNIMNSHLLSLTPFQLSSIFSSSLKTPTTSS